MRFCVISDTHGNIDYINLLADKLKGTLDLIIHLGDDSPDANVLTKKGFNIIKVPGVFEHVYYKPREFHRKIEKFDNIKFLLTHTPSRHENDFTDEPGPEELSKKVDVVLYGHLHVPSIEMSDGVIWINPGHMKKKDKRFPVATYCVIDIGVQQSGKKKININIIEFTSDNTLFSKEFYL